MKDNTKYTGTQNSDFSLNEHFEKKSRTLMNWSDFAFRAFQLLLYPFSVLYDLITIVRNKGYDFGIFNTYQPPIFTINVGNLTVGGTGKTPHVEYLIRLLSSKYKVAVLSRGYGRKTKGFILASTNSTAKSIGDEPMQYFLKFGGNVKIAVCEKRVYGAKKLLELFPDLQVLILDDAYQHRAIRPHFNILLTDFGRLFYKDWLLPMGRLRERRSGANRADWTVISKCPNDLTDEIKTQIKKEIIRFSTSEISFSRIKYGELTCYKGVTIRINSPIIGLSGIAQPQIFNDFLEKNYEVKFSKNFADHRNFTRNDIDEILRMNQTEIIVTTEKDFVKINRLLSNEEKSRFAYLPIEIDFWNDKSLDDIILRRINESI